jgi:tRNA pseudouridine38-40 synthase
MKILLTLSYLGKDFSGYQVQKNARTVQGELNTAARSLFGYDCDITGCSRTDAGVHANMFCATVTKKGESYLETHILENKIPAAMNAHLPYDVAVERAEWVSDDFHPRYDVKYKEYVYHIWNCPHRNPFTQDRSWHYPKQITDEALNRMNQAALYFCGTHDFTSYMAADTKITDAVRTIYEAEVTRKGSLIEFRVRANGFLYNMVRILVGTVIAVAENKLDPEDIPTVTEARDRTRAGITVPAHGLFLNRVEY